MSKDKRFFTYIAQCADGTLYTGWTTNIERRIAAHNGGAKGAKYTKTRRPVVLAHSEAFATRSEAMRREAAVKKLTRTKKMALYSKANKTITPKRSTS